MREVKVYKPKVGGEFLVAFEYDSSSAWLRVLENDMTARDLFDHIHPSSDATMRILKRMSNIQPSLGGRLIYHSSEVRWNDATFTVWKEKMITMLEKKGTIHEPTVIDETLKARIRMVSGGYDFTMTLDHWENDEKVPITFHFSVGSRFSLAADYDLRYKTTPETPSHSIIGAAADKFNYLTFAENKIFFCDKKELNSAHWELARQSTKVSKVIKSLFGLHECRVGVENSTLIHTYDLQSSEHIDGGERMRMEGCSSSVSLKKMKYYIEKGKDRLYELLTASFKPQEFTIKLTDNVEKIYGVDKADKGSGSLGNSCMSAHNRGSYTCAQQSAFYNYLNGAQIAYALDKEDRLLGRVLLWKGFAMNRDTKKYTDKITFLDRIYGSEDFIMAMRNWAGERDYYWRLDQSAGSYALTNKKGVRVEKFKSEVTKLPFGKVNRRVPYFDTMKHFNVLSKSKSYARLQLFSTEQPGSQKMSGTDASILIIRCENCGIIIVKKHLTTAYTETRNRQTACVNCSSAWGSHRFMKSKSDVKLSFSSQGHKTMPILMQPERLVSIKIDGKEITFDAHDGQGIKDFFKSKTKKGDSFEKTYSSNNSFSHPW